MLYKPDFWFSRSFSWAGRQHCPKSEKQYHKNGCHLHLVAHFFTNLSQNVCPINTQILIYRHSRCVCNLWHAFWFYYDFFHTLLLIIHVWNVISPPNFYWFYIYSILIFKMSDVTASYGIPLNFITFLRILHKTDEYSCLKCFLSSPIV